METVYNTWDYYSGTSIMSPRIYSVVLKPHIMPGTVIISAQRYSVILKPKTCNVFALRYLNSCVLAHSGGVRALARDEIERCGHLICDGEILVPLYDSVCLAVGCLDVAHSWRGRCCCYVARSRQVLRNVVVLLPQVSFGWRVMWER